MNDHPIYTARSPGNGLWRERRGAEVHAAIQREKREPRVGLEPLSLWLIAIYGLAIFFGGAYLGRYSGNFSGDRLDPLGGAQPAKQHGRRRRWRSADGGAFSGRARQKRFSRRIARSAIRRADSGCKVRISAARRFGNCEWRLASCRHGRDEGFARSDHGEGPTVRNRGHATVGKDAERSKGCRCPDFIRQEWGNTGGPVSAEQIAALRKELAGRADSWTEADLKAVPPDTNLPGGEGGARAA